MIGAMIGDITGSRFEWRNINPKQNIRASRTAERQEEIRHESWLY